MVGFVAESTENSRNLKGKVVSANFQQLLIHVNTIPECERYFRGMNSCMSPQHARLPTDHLSPLLFIKLVEPPLLKIQTSKNMRGHSFLVAEDALKKMACRKKREKKWRLYTIMETGNNLNWCVIPMIVALFINKISQHFRNVYCSYISKIYILTDRCTDYYHHLIVLLLQRFNFFWSFIVDWPP